jgi:hypothetical protein
MQISCTGTQENGILRSIFDKVPGPLLSSLLTPEPMKLNHPEEIPSREQPQQFRHRHQAKSEIRLFLGI